ncbi:MAG: DegV family protein [Lachnospiraceae bacterium]|nr:DegV family protein [Lachnospiraceae bacterium]
MSDYVIVVDLSANISMDFVREHDLIFIPMNYSIGSEERVSSEMESDEMMKEFYKAQREGVETKTSQITPQQYVEFFEPYLKEGKDIVYLSLSSGLSNTFNSVCLAKRDLEEEYPDVHVYPVDTLAGTGCVGLISEQAALNREAGMSAEENYNNLCELVDSLCHVFMVDDLMYLHRGGRVPKSTAIMGTVLNIKPVLIVNEEGKLPMIDKKRGVKPAMNRLVEIYEKTHRTDMNRVYIVHADALDRAEFLRDKVLAINPNADIEIQMLCPVIGAHTGPGMCAILYYGDRHHLD